MKAVYLIFTIIISTISIFAQNQKTLSDSEIVDAVEDQFRFDHAVDVNKINISCRDGIVELAGTVDNLKAKERATKLTEIVKGVRVVSNRINVVPSKPESDETVKSNVEKALFNDPAADSYELKVLVDKGVVTLSGTVDSYKEKELSANVASSVSGVVALQNQIVVKYKTNRPDIEIEKEIQEALKWNQFVNDGSIKVIVKNGNVTLTGIVGSAAEKTNATLTAFVSGVKSVENTNLEVQPWTDNANLRKNKNVAVSDPEIVKAIKDAALLDPRISSSNIEPVVTSGWVILRGSVDNLRAKVAAENLAKNTWGVIGVTNRLKIQSKLYPTDSNILNNIKAGLQINSITNMWDIHVFVKNGVVTLTGNVDNNIEKNEAEWVVSGVRGVSSIINQIKVNYPYAYYWYDSYPSYLWYYPTPANPLYVPVINDNVIKMNVVKELWRSPFVNTANITVEVNNGKVILKGTVDNMTQYQKAYENAWEGGALAVENQLILEKR